MAAPFTNGPLLGDAGHVFLLTKFENPLLLLTAHDVQTGSVAWQHEVPVSDDDFVHWFLLTSAGVLVLNVGNRAIAVATGGERPPACAFWPTPRGGVEQRVAAFGR